MAQVGHGTQRSSVEREAESPLPRLPRRYQPLGVLGHGGMGEVYRVLDRLRRQQVALKHVRHLNGGGTAQETAVDPSRTWLISDAALSASDGGTQPAAPDAPSNRETRVAVEQHSRMAIANEFRTLASLRHPHIISVLDYGFDQQGSPFFTMELLADAQPFTLGDSVRDPQGLVELTAQLLAALAYLHRHGILHRDLKPSNVLLSRGRVKVLDFGVATHASLIHDVAGTLEYMAPELLLGGTPSAASDLYAVGVLLWEALTGCYPFARDSATQFLVDVLGPHDSGRLPPHILPLLRRPGWSQLPLSSQWQSVGAGTLETSPVALAALELRRSEALSQIPAELREFVSRLLQRDPLARFESAEAAAQALSQATGLALHGHLRATRESLLSAAPFLGRSLEMSLLQGALSQARAGTGSLLLLGGESGVGKSRLLEELRTLALVAGTQVFSGQAATFAGSPLDELAQLLRPLCLQIDLEDDSAAILAELIPDLATLLDRPLPSAPRLDSQAAQGRLLATIESLLRTLRSPSVLILEDAQWAASETIALLQRLQPHLPQLPLLIVVSYRDDEAPELPRSLPAGLIVPVRRLDQGAVAELARAMLGTRGANPILLQQLQRESEGNTLFLIEVTRALAEEEDPTDPSLSRGDVEGATRLATLTGGMRALLKRRLRRVPEREQAALQLMAVAGRAIDLNLLRQLGTDTDAFLVGCAEAGVLEVQEDAWRFSHDKLRETLISELTSDGARALHGKIAEASEQLYGDSAEHAAAIAHHLEQAGESERALHYAVVAGQYALRRGAPVEAERILAGVTRVLPRSTLSDWQMARAFRLHAQALAAIGRMAGCVEACRRGLAVIGQPVPQETTGLVAGVLRQGLGQIVRRLAGRTWRGRTSPLLAEEAARLLALAGEASVFELQHLRMAYCMLATTNAADDCSAVEQQIYGYGSLGLILSLTPLRWVADGYFERAQSLLSERRGQEPRAEIELHRLRAVSKVGAGQLHAALAESTVAVQAAAHLRDGPLRMASLIVRRMSYMHLGEFATALRDGEEVAQLAREGHHVQQLAWALAINALLFLRMGQLGRAHLELAEAAEAVKDARDQAARCAVDALRAQLRLRQDNLDGCRELLQPTIATLLSSKITAPGMLVCFRGLLDTGLALLDRTMGARTVADQDIAANIQIIGERLRRYARANVVARPAAALAIGQLAMRSGEFEAALAALGRALRTAQALEMPFDQAEAHEALARLGQSWPPLRPRPPVLDPAATRGHLESARQIYQKLGAAWHLAALPGAAEPPAPSAP